MRTRAQYRIDATRKQLWNGDNGWSIDCSLRRHPKSILSGY